jgi:acetolactate decarboxylase
VLLLQLTILGMLCLVGCCKTTTVEQYGGMRDTLRMGNTQPRVTFDEITATPNAFAVGALPNLEGEITIFDGNVWVATTDGTSATTERANTQYNAATLLTVSHIESWVEFDLPNLPLEEAIEFVAQTYEPIDVSTPFPFLIIGDSSEFHMHVINGYCPVASPNLADEFKPWRLNIEKPTPITVVGFFAKNQEGVMTHHGSNIHIHGILDKNGAVATGHLDSVVFMKGATLYLPAS